MNTELETLKKHILEVITPEYVTVEHIDVVDTMLDMHMESPAIETDSIYYVTAMDEDVFIEFLIDEYTIGLEVVPPKGTIITLNMMIGRVLDAFAEDFEDNDSDPECVQFDFYTFMVNFAEFLDRDFNYINFEF